MAAFPWQILVTLRRKVVSAAGPAVAHYAPRALLSLASLALIAWATLAIRWPEAGLERESASGVVVNVFPDSPAVAAGLQPGDRLIKIDDHPQAGASFVAGRQPGDVVTLTVSRGSEMLTVPLTLQPVGLDDAVWRAIPVAVALVFWLAAVIVFFLRPRASPALAFFNLSNAVAVLLVTGQLSTLDVAAADRIFGLAACAFPPLLVRFYRAFGVLKLPNIERCERGLIAISLVLAIPFVALPAAVLYEAGWYSRLRGVVFTYASLALLAVIVNLIYFYHTTTASAARRRLRALAVGAVVGALPIFLLSLLPNAVNRAPGLPFQVSFAFLVFVAVSHAYAIVQDDTRQLDRLLNRSILVFSLGLVWVLLYVGAARVALALFHDAGATQPLVGALVTMALALVFAPLRSRLQRGIDGLFYGGWYDYKTVIGDLSTRLSRVTTRQELVDCLIEPVVRDLRLRGAALYLRDDDGEFRLQRSCGLAAGERLERRVWAPVVAPNAGQDARLPLDAVMAGQVGCTLPLFWKDRLVGLLLLGTQRDDDFFEPTDQAIWRTLQEQAALAVANVTLLDNLRQALAALEAAQQKSLAMVEQERHALARDLHDGPVQDLVALSYQLSECRDRAWMLDVALAERLETTRRKAVGIMSSARSICSTLRSDLLDVMGLEPAMRAHAFEFMQKTGMTIYLDMAHEGTKVPDPLGITLFRVFQEALNNAAAHAGTTDVWVYFRLEGANYELRVWDDGRGFELPAQLEALALQGHFGILTMKERIASVRGDFEIKAAPEKGVCIVARGGVRKAECGIMQ